MKLFCFNQIIEEPIKENNLFINKLNRSKIHSNFNVKEYEDREEIDMGKKKEIIHKRIKLRTSKCVWENITDF